MTARALLPSGAEPALIAAAAAYLVGHYVHHRGHWRDVALRQRSARWEVVNDLTYAMWLDEDIAPACDPECGPDAPSWKFESLDFTTTRLAAASCGQGTVPVYRAYNNGAGRGIDSNHRITTNRTAIDQVVARGWVDEGIAMCAPR